MSETRDRYTPEEILTVMSVGVSLAPFAGIHELLTHLVGWPIFTHHLADRETWERCAEGLKGQHPEMVSEIDGPLLSDLVAHKGDQDRHAVLVRHLRATYGETLPVAPLAPGTVPYRSALEGMPEHTTPILVEADPDAGEEGLRHAAEQIKQILQRDREEQGGA